MKTGKKILAVLLVFCFVLAAVPVYATTLTNIVDDAWEYWDENGEANMDVTITIPNNSDVIVAPTDGTLKTLLNAGVFFEYQFSVKDGIVLKNGDKTYTISVDKLSFSRKNAFYVTPTFFSNSHHVVTEMVAAASDENLKPYLYFDENDAVVATHSTNDVTLSDGKTMKKYEAFRHNIFTYIAYKLGYDLTGSIPQKYTATVNATVHAKSTFNADDSFPKGSFFIADEKINTFVGGETPVTGAYVITIGNSAGLYASTLQDSNLDGPYTVFTAPATGVYDVFASKRDGSTNTSKSMRHIALDIAGETYEFSNTQAPDTIPNKINDYYWEPATGSKAVSLTKGQQVPIRILSETGSYAGANGVAFCPRADAETPVTIQKDASPVEPSGVTIETSVPAAETATVTVDGEEVVITAGAAEAYYPNVRKSDANGNYINKPTLLDALVTLDKQEDIGIVAHTLLPDGCLNTGQIDTMAITPETAPLHNIPWPHNANLDEYADIFTKDEGYYDSVPRTLTMCVKVPEDGTYYFIFSGNAYSSSRSVKAAVDGHKFYADVAGTDETIVTNGTDNEIQRKQSANGIQLTAGYHTLSVSLSSGVIRINYAGLVKAESQEEAATIQASFTNKATFNAYMNGDTLNVFDGDKIVDMNVAVNDELITENFDRYILSDGDEVHLNVFDPISLNGKIQAVSGNISYHTNRWLSDETLAVSDYVVTMSSGQIAALNKVLPVDVTEKDSMRGMYLNGYLGFTADDAGTDGDETLVNNYICYEIKGNSQCIEVTQNEDGSESVCGRLVIAIDAITKNSVNVTFDGKTYKNIYGSFNEAYKNYDWTNCYLTDSRFDGDATVKAEYADGKVVISSKKAQPIFVIVKNADGSKASAANHSLMFDTSIEVPVEAGQTVYVWGGTQYKANGTTALPLCAPVTAPVAE